MSENQPPREPWCDSAPSSGVSVPVDTKVKRMTLEAVVIRADGSREDLGTIAYWDHRWYRRLWARLQGRGRIAAGG